MEKSLKVNRDQQDVEFVGWKLGSGLVREVVKTNLPGNLYLPPRDATDYAHTYAAVLHNGLFPLAKGYGILTETDQGLCLWELGLVDGGITKAGYKCLQEGLIADPSAVGRMSDSPLPASFIEVQQKPGEYSGREILVSTGSGDLRLISLDDSSTASCSDCAYPMRHPPPSTDIHPFVISAACRKEGSLLCVVWTTSDHCCETWAIQLNLENRKLTVLHTESLKASSVPPFLCVVSGESESLILAASPVEEPAEQQREGLGKHANPEPSTAGNPSGEDNVDPQLLSMALGKLQSMTDEQQKDLPAQQWADLYKESGPDGLGAIGQEPPCTLHIFSVNKSRTDESDMALDASPQALQFECVETINCHPCGFMGVLGSCNLNGEALLAVNDDVDAALLQLNCKTRQVDHIDTVPALGYVAAGKTQRKYFIPAPPGGPFSAFLIESAKLAYAYRSTKKAEQSASFEVLDIQMQVADSDVSGAALNISTSPPELIILTQHTVLVYKFNP